MKQSHRDALTLKQETLERIKRLHIKCGFLDAEHLLMIPKTWLEYQQYSDVHVEITQNFYNAYCTQKYFFVEKDFESWYPKIHGPRNYLQSFQVASLTEVYGNEKQYPFEMFLNSISKNTRSHYKGTKNNGNSLSYSDSEMEYKVEKKSPFRV